MATAGRAGLPLMTSLIDEAIERRAADATALGRDAAPRLPAHPRHAAQVVHRRRRRLPAGVPDATCVWWAARTAEDCRAAGSRPTPSSCSPAASASRARPAAATRSGSSTRSTCTRRLRPYARPVVGLRLQLSRSRGDARARHRPRRARLRDRARGARDQHLSERRVRRRDSPRSPLATDSLVSSPYHMRRATLVWRKLAPDIVVMPSPPPRASSTRTLARRHPRADPRHPPGVPGDPRLLVPRLAVNGAVAQVARRYAAGGRGRDDPDGGGVESGCVYWEPRRRAAGVFSDRRRTRAAARARLRRLVCGRARPHQQPGFPRPRDYRLAKAANTFRILVLGDSVTFGHGSIYDTPIRI